MARAVLVAQDTINRQKEQLYLKEKQLQLQAPKVEYFDEVLNSDNLIPMTIIAKDLGMSAIALNKTLHKMNVIYRCGKTWVAYSKYQENDFFKSKTHPYVNEKGEQHTAIHFYATEKGRQFIMNTLKK